MSEAYAKIISFIDANLKNEITAADVARAAGYSANHVYKLFKAYSPHPPMEYVRRKRLYSAASEIYLGRKITDVALDYGFETPAGFYKAFKSVFGCSPREYKNNFIKEKFEMKIDHVKSVDELKEVLAFYKSLYSGHPIAEAVDSEGGEKYGRGWWEKTFGEYGELFLYARDGEKICAFALGFSDDGNYLTVQEGVLNEYKSTGIFEALFAELEKRAKRRGFSGVALGIGEGEEEFYAKLGYIGKTLIQSEKYGVEELIKFNERRGAYEVAGSGVYEGYVSQLWLNASLLDKGLKKYFEEEIGDCRVQVIASKAI